MISFLMASNEPAAAKSGLQRLWRFGSDEDLRRPSTTQAASEDEGNPGTPPSVIRHRRADPRGDFRLNPFSHSFSSDAINAATSNRQMKLDEAIEETEEGRRRSPNRHRRVKSYTGLADWHLLDSGPAFRPRTYTRSLEYLVQHLAPTTDSDGTLPSSPTGKKNRVWSPRHGNVIPSVPAVEYQMKYEFALILHNKPTTPRILARNGLDAVGKRQMEVLSRCIMAGFEVSVLSSTLYSRKYLVLLLSPLPSRLQTEKNRLVLERWLQIGAVGEVPSEIEELIASSNIGDVESPAKEAAQEDTKQLESSDNDKFTPAERIQTIARIITSTSNVEELNPPGANISFEELNRNDTIIMACFPLHNRHVDNMLLAKCGHWWWKSTEITNELRYYYGERVAFYFSFLFVYTKCLLVPALVGCGVYISCRWVGSVAYMRSLCIFGFCTVTIWGAFFLKAWTRQNNLLNDAWNLRLFKEADYPNATFKPQGYRDVVDSHGVLLFREPYYNPLLRIPAYLQTFMVFALFIATYVVGTAFFVQWCTAAMMAPVCSKCPKCVAFLSCFNTERPILFTDRWCYIFAQGLLLGISLDIVVYLLSVKLIRFFVTRENHVMDAHFQRTMVNRLFAINWISFFLWFMLISFVIIPFGSEVETWLSANLKYTKLTVQWQGGVIDMSTAFVTPLLITQALNLLIDTSLPIIFRRETLRASKLAKKIMKANPAETLLALSEYHSSFENLPSDLSPSNSSRSVAFKTKIELQMMTPIRIPYLEDALGVSIPTLEGFENEKYFMTADDVLEESQLPLYNAFPDYLRMVIQYGYVVMFSVVWPFCAMAAFANNIIHIQNSFYKLVLLRRRPVPRKANSIGQWEKMLFITLFLALFVVVGLICVSTGELEYFISECLALERFNGKDFSMGPEFSCLSISSRFIVALVLEHAAFLIVYVLTDYISDTPASVRTSFERKKELIRRAICGQGTTPTQKPDSKGVPIHHGPKSFDSA
ncbi:Anoctamin-like protein [Phytophthora citrophthora]|uniref:Anoctamin-like protein n=1 Tax=Phytophthora citrophthora TaxID=4793 RepID=A0AAD9LBV7_9STRA|nr:Anoctamin-like protein [Phytophthora citrophthora]